MEVTLFEDQVLKEVQGDARQEDVHAATGVTMEDYSMTKVSQRHSLYLYLSFQEIKTIIQRTVLS